MDGKEVCGFESRGMKTYFWTCQKMVDIVRDTLDMDLGGFIFISCDIAEYG